MTLLLIILLAAASPNTTTPIFPKALYQVGKYLSSPVSVTNANSFGVTFAEWPANPSASVTSEILLDGVRICGPARFQRKAAKPLPMPPAHSCTRKKPASGQITVVLVVAGGPVNTSADLVTQ